MCFQEVDKFHDLEEDLRVRGYSGIWKMRTGDPIDGCAIFWRTTRFKLMYEECIEFNKHGMRDNVAQICVLESLIPNQNGNQLASSTCPEGLNRVVICNIHVLYNPRRGEIKLGQVRLLLERAQAVSKTWDDAPVVVCGDFNCTPMSPLYNFISEQKLDISELDRDKVSGQASAEIFPALRQHGPQPREQPAGDITNPSTVQNYSIDTKQSDSLEDENDSESISENLQTPVSLHQPPPVDSLRNVPVNSFENNRGLFQSIESLKDSEIDHTDMILNEVRSSESADQLIDETLKSPKFASVPPTENVISSGLLLKEQDSEEISISEDSSQMGNSDRLSSATDYFDKNIVEKETRDNSNSNMSQSHNSFSSITELNPTNTREASHPNTTSASNHDIDEKIIGLSLNEVDESLEDDGVVGEVVEEFLSDLNNGGDVSPPDLGDLVPEVETVGMDKPYYDPSLWTPMEIATATGNANCTILEHPLKLRSAYTEVVDSSVTRDSNGEPLVTSYNTCFMGTVDYIWRSEGLCTTKVLAPIPKDAMQNFGGFPTKKWGSDHIALASELAFTRKLNV